MRTRCTESEPSFVGTLKLVKLKLLLELRDVVLRNLDLALRVLVQLLDLVGRDFSEFILDFFPLHHVDLHLLNDESWYINRFITSFAHGSLLSESILKYLEDLPLLVLLSVVKTGLNCKFLFFLLLPVLATELLGALLGPAGMNTAAAP